MAYFSYGTKEYYEKELKMAKLKKELLQEAIGTRLKDNLKENCCNIDVFLELLQKAMRDENDSKEYLDEQIAKEKAEAAEESEANQGV